MMIGLWQGIVTDQGSITDSGPRAAGREWSWEETMARDITQAPERDSARHWKAHRSNQDGRAISFTAVGVHLTITCGLFAWMCVWMPHVCHDSFLITSSAHPALWMAVENGVSMTSEPKVSGPQTLDRKSWDGKAAEIETALELWTSVSDGANDE